MLSGPPPPPPPPPPPAATPPMGAAWLDSESRARLEAREVDGDERSGVTSAVGTGGSKLQTHSSAPLSPDPRRRGRGAARDELHALRVSAARIVRAPGWPLSAPCVLNSAQRRCSNHRSACAPALYSVTVSVRVGGGRGEGPRGRGHALARSTAGPALQPLNGSCVPSWGRTPTERLSRLLLFLFVRLLCADGSGS